MKMNPYASQSSVSAVYIAALFPDGDVTNTSICRLHEQLRDCERRLGTADESPDDLERARHIAHEINNRLTLACLHAELGEGLELSNSERADSAFQLVA